MAMVAGILMGTATRAPACPFCSAESKTLTEETQTSDAVVLAKLVKEAAPPDQNSSGDDFGGISDDGMATFRVVEVLQGQDLVAKEQEIEVVFFGEPDREQVFLISGIGTDQVDWTTPLPLSAAAVDYVRKLAGVPPSGVERLAFFQEYLENNDPLLAQDAYDEFARAPYAEVIALKPRMNHDRLVGWIDDPEISPSRRRLYLTMLGVCGTADDLPLLEALIKSDFRAMKPHLEQLVHTGLALGGPIGLPAWIDIVDQDERRKKLGLDALVACYLTLRGPEGLDLVDERFLKNQNTEYTYIYSTIMALRFHGEEPTSVLPRERLLASVRLLLDNPEFADQVIPDLARWEDWSVLDRLVNMFKTSDKNGYVRQPVVTYLTVASEQPGEVGTKAQTALAELEQLDPEGVKQARSLMAFGALSRARAGGGATATKTEPETTNSDTAGEFAATAAEIQSGEDAKPGDFADPANFADKSQSPSTESNSATSDDSPGAAKPPVQETTSPSSPTAASATQAASQSVTAAATAMSVTADEAELAASEPNSVLMVGVPLVAAVLLMGIYWVILRTGAV
jgi:hypothetical protein